MTSRAERLRAAGLTESEVQAVLRASKEVCISITVRVPLSHVEKIDAKTNNRSDYIRSLIERDLDA